MVRHELPIPFLSAEDLGEGNSFGKNKTSLPHVSLESYSATFYRERIQRFIPGTIIISKTTFSDNSVIVNQETCIELTKKDIIDREHSKKNRNKNVKIATISTTLSFSKGSESAFLANEDVDNVAKRMSGRVNQDQEISTFIIYGVDRHNIIINLHPIKSPLSPESGHKQQKDLGKEEYYFKLDLGENSSHSNIDISKDKDRIITLQILDFYKCKKGTIKLRTGWKSRKAFESLLSAYTTVYPHAIAAIFRAYGKVIPEHIEFAFPKS